MRSRSAAALALVLGAGLLVGYAGPADAGKRPRAVVQSMVIGHSVKGRPIVAKRLGNPKSPRKVLVMSAIHGDEPGPGRIIRRLINGPKVHGADVWVIRVINPDGMFRHTRKNARGVDLNRNFPRQWQRVRGRYDSGPRPASEPETRALMRFMKKVRPKYVISFHQPLYGVGRSGLRRGVPFQRKVARQLRLPLKSFNCTGACHGTMTEWYNHRFKNVALTVEYGHGMTRRQLRTAPSAVLRAVGAHR